MSETPPEQIKLNDVMFQALDHAAACVRDTGETLIPFSIVETADGERTMRRYMAERIEEGVAQGRKTLIETKADIMRYAFAWDGFVTIEGKKWDAVIVEAGDKIAPTGILICQRYEKKGFLKKKTELCGNPAVIGNPASAIN